MIESSKGEQQMLKAIFLILTLFSLTIFAQDDNGEKPVPTPQAVKYDEFGKAPNGYVKWRMDAYFTELSNNPTTQGYIINYGLPRDIAVRVRQLREAIKFRRYDATRMTFVEGGTNPTVKTELWLVPQGAENPEPKTTARLTDEFGKINGGELKARLDMFFLELNNFEKTKGFILSYGTKQQIALREKQIKQYITIRKFDLSKITFITAGSAKTIKTEFWIDAKTP